jgi:ADP-ribosylglycohydrolase
MSREWVCFEHGRVHDDAEQAVYCQDGEWRETPEPPRSEFRKRYDDIFLRARGQHPDQVEATIKALGTCDRREAP